MKLSLPLLVAGASLVSATPLSIMISTTEVRPFRLGAPAAYPPAPGRNEMHAAIAVRPTRMRHLCDKMQGGVSRFLASIGMPHDEHEHGHPPPPIAPFFVGGSLLQDIPLPEAGAQAEPQAEHSGEGQGRRVMMHHHHHGFRPMRHHRGSFTHRIHRALMTLGPWEGRAVAFVLGCGIGVLLRMFWVLSLLVFRAVKGSTGPDAREYEEIAVFYAPRVHVDAEELFVAPPEYTDEKVALAQDAGEARA
ncbi:hypothetical protein OF83DRAFT_1177423 [Amylostereum chailletii]|nr:hypothetical protein OF83DRAFT_1177423 [Amylostereum chailletii]